MSKEEVGQEMVAWSQSKAEKQPLWFGKGGSGTHFEREFVASERVTGKETLYTCGHLPSFKEATEVKRNLPQMQE